MAKKAYIGVDGVARKIKKGYLGIENFVPRSLPNGYTQVEYIESDKGQHIDTGFKPSSNTKIKMVVGGWPATIAAAALYGTRTASNDWIECYSASTDQYRFVYGGNSVYFDTTVSYDDKVTVIQDKNTIIIGNHTQTVAEKTFTCTTNLYLFAYNNNGTVAHRGAIILYSCQIYENDVLVRDYVPCINPNGEIGLYDMVDGVFYANVGTGAFTAGTSVYESVAHKIKKAYIGIGGVARPCWSGGELAYYGVITPLSGARYRLAATTVGTYALFGGGRDSSTFFSTVDAYSKSLTHTTPTALSVGRSSLAAAVIGDYALFGGGSYTSSYTTLENTVDAYDISLTRTTPTALSGSRDNLAAASSSQYALFGGGNSKNVVDAYDTSLTRITPTTLSMARNNLAATTIGDYVLFGGGYRTISSIQNIVDAYDTSLTRTNPTALSLARYNLGATTIGNYALFGGGAVSNNNSNTVDAYDVSLTRTTPTGLSAARSDLVAVTIGNYALFGGGTMGSPSDSVNAYDKALTRTIPTALNVARDRLAATTVGNYALFAGGNGADGVSKIVDAYTLV